MLDLGHLPVQGHRAHHLSAKGLPNGLMAKADAKDRNARRCSLDDLEADTGFVGAKDLKSAATINALAQSATAAAMIKYRTVMR